MNVAEIQEALRREGLDGWLFFDHHQRDPLAYRVLGFSPASHVTRRWYYFIPAAGEPVGRCSVAAGFVSCSINSVAIKPVASLS